jgi:Golgi nucleoside diphosphatase
MRCTGKLLPASAGVGTVDANSSVGALDLGGASTQIAFFVPNQDILANMFKLQLGGQKHWNVYVHSFLYYGINSARDRLEERLADDAVTAGRKKTTTYCLPYGFDETIRDVGNEKVQISGEYGNNFDDCLTEVMPLLHQVGHTTGD